MNIEEIIAARNLATENMETIDKLIKEKKMLQDTLSQLWHGSIEIKKVGGADYIYRHFREDGVPMNKYVGQFDEGLIKRIAADNKIAKELKRRLKEINKELSSVGYADKTLNKYVNTNIALAKRYLVESVYKQSITEGIATTLSETEAVIEGRKNLNLDATEIIKIHNLALAWNFITNAGVLSCGDPYSVIANINKIVNEDLIVGGGELRFVPVTIGGSTYRPPFPIEGDVKANVNEIEGIDNALDKAVEAFLYVTKAQLFNDGNKRTAMLFANYLLIQEGKGLLSIPTDKNEQFKKLLVHYYETGEKREITQFLKEECFEDLEPYWPNIK